MIIEETAELEQRFTSPGHTDAEDSPVKLPVKDSTNGKKQAKVSKPSDKDVVAMYMGESEGSN